MNILILHAHWHNRGDESAIRAMIDSLRAHLPVEKMRIMLMAGTDEWFPYDDVERLQILPPKFTKKRDLADMAFNVLTLGRLSFTDRVRAFIRAANEADIVIHAPGGPTIGDLYGGPVIRDLPYLYRLLVAKVFKRKPLFFYAPSMGPFSGRLRNWARRFILKRADAIILREEISRRYLRDQLGLEAYVTLDSAFQNDIPEDYIQRYHNLSETLQVLEGRKAVAMVVTDLKWHPVYRYREGLAGRIMASCTGVADYLLEKGYSILLMPQLFAKDESLRQLDIRLLESIREINTERIHICPPDVDSYGQQVIISKLFALISMRYHPVVFAAKANTPFISIYYEHKAEGFARKVGLSDFTIHVEALSASEIVGKFEVLERDYDTVTERLRTLNPLLKEESRKTTRIIVDRLKQLGLIIDRKGR